MFAYNTLYSVLGTEDIACKHPPPPVIELLVEATVQYAKW